MAVMHIKGVSSVRKKLHRYAGTMAYSPPHFWDLALWQSKAASLFINGISSLSAFHFGLFYRIAKMLIESFVAWGF
jgi:hypothetical protein